MDGVREAEPGTLQVQGQPRLLSEILSQSKTTPSTYRTLCKG